MACGWGVRDCIVTVQCFKRLWSRSFDGEFTKCPIQDTKNCLACAKYSTLVPLQICCQICVTHLCSRLGCPRCHCWTLHTPRPSLDAPP